MNDGKLCYVVIYYLKGDSIMYTFNIYINQR